MAYNPRGIANQGASFNIPMNSRVQNAAGRLVFYYSETDTLSQITNNSLYFSENFAVMAEGDVYFLKGSDSWGFFIIDGIDESGLYFSSIGGGGGGGGDYLQKSANLSDVNNVEASQENLELLPGVNIQSWSSNLDGLSSLPSGTVGILKKTGLTYGTVSLIGTENKITVVNGTGESGNPTFTLPNYIDIQGVSNGTTKVVEYTNNGGPNYVGFTNDLAHIYATVEARSTNADAILRIRPKGAGIVAVASSDGFQPSKLGLAEPNSNFAFIFYGPSTLSQNVPFQVPDTIGPDKTTFVNQGDGSTRWDYPLFLSGGTLTGNLFLNGDPLSANQAVNKQYVDDLEQNLHPHGAVDAVAVDALTATYSNGTLGVGATLVNSSTQEQFSVPDSSGDYLPPLNARILVPSQVSGLENGIYILTDQGSVSTNWTLVRATDWNAEGNSNIEQYAYVPVTHGSQAGTTWLMTTPPPYIVGTTAFSWVLGRGVPVYSGANGIEIHGTVISIADIITAGSFSYPSSVNINAQGQVTSISSGGMPLVAANNLGDVPNAVTALDHLGGQPLNPKLTSISNASDASGYVSFDDDTGISVIRKFSSPNNTIAIVSPDGVSGDTEIIIPDKTANRLAVYDGDGAFSVGTVGTNLSLVNGVLNASTGSGSILNFIAYKAASASIVEFNISQYPQMGTYQNFYISFYNISGESAGTVLGFITRSPTGSGSSVAMGNIFPLTNLGSSNTAVSGSMTLFAANVAQPTVEPPVNAVFTTIIEAKSIVHTSGVSTGVGNPVNTVNGNNYINTFGADPITGIIFQTSTSSFLGGRFYLYGY